MQHQKFHTSLAGQKLLAKFHSYFWIPQALTGLRLLAGPVVLWALLTNHATLAFWLVCFASLTDWLDGASARFLSIETEFGRTFDPIADKVFILCVCAGLFAAGKLPFWLISIIIFRDSLILLGGLWIKKKKVPYTLNPIRISKYNTGLQMSLVGWLLLAPLLPPLNFYPLFSSALIYGTLTTTLLSGFVYARIFIHFYRAAKFFKMAPGDHSHCTDDCRHTLQP